MLVCLCTAVTEEDIQEAVTYCDSFQEMQEFTGAGTGCESCLAYVMELWEKNASNRRPCRKKSSSADK